MKYRFARLAHHRAEAVHPAHVMYAVHRDSIVIVNLPDYRQGATPQASRIATNVRNRRRMVI
jgi:hypothetical protein